MTSIAARTTFSGGAHPGNHASLTVGSYCWQAWAHASRVHTSGSLGTPLCLGTITLNGVEHVMYGDSCGMVNMLLVDTSEPFQTRDLLYTDETQDYVCLHDKHRDWVTKARFYV